MAASRRKNSAQLPLDKRYPSVADEMSTSSEETEISKPKKGSTWTEMWAEDTCVGLISPQHRDDQ
jgi:hypothetical protein